MFRSIDDRLRLTDAPMIRQRNYWLKKLSGEIEETGLLWACRPGAGDSEIGGGVGQRAEIVIPAHLSLQLLELANHSDLSLYIALLALLKLLIRRYTQREDITVLSPVYQSRVSEDTCNGLIPIRDEMGGRLTFREAILTVRRSVLDAYDNQDYPFAKIHRQLAARGQGLNTRVVCLLKNIHADMAQEAPGERLVFAFFRKDSQIGGSILYDARLYEDYQVSQAARHFVRLLARLCQDREAQAAETGILSQEERHRLLHRFNDTAILDYDTHQTVVHLFERQAAQTAPRTALTADNSHLSYGEVAERAGRLARLLSERGVEADVPVAIMMDASTDMVIGIMAILKAGGAYVPVAGDYPGPRQAFMMNDCRAEILLVKGGGGAPVEELPLPIKAGNIIAIDDEIPYTQRTAGINYSGSPGDAAYIIYTSGTTGNPKGVIVEHRNVVNLVTGLQEIVYRYYEQNLKVALLAPYVFDASVQQIFGVLLTGHNLHIVPQEVRSDGARLWNYYRTFRIDISDGTPSHLRLLAACSGQERVGDMAVRHFLIGGEALAAKLVKDFFNMFGHRAPRLTNVYGPTECCVDCTWFEVSRENIDDLLDIDRLLTVPIGKPMPGEQVYILDKRGQVQPVGVAGELYIGGAGVGRGYLNGPPLTAGKFFVNPFVEGEGLPMNMYGSGDLARWLPTGDLEFLGRLDYQVKIRGYRLEPAEIECRLMKIDDIEEAVVAVRESTAGDRRPAGAGEDLCLAAYVVANKKLAVKEIRESLAVDLPAYMIPTQIVQVPEIPLTPNGKVDRKRLIGLEIEAGGEYVAPADDIEAALVRIWADVLDLETAGIGVEDDFFQLGGHSLKATILISRLQVEFKVEYPFHRFFAGPTVRAMGRFIKSTVKTVFAAVRPAEKREYYPLSSAQKRLFFLDRLENVGTTYHMPAILKVEGEIERRRLEQTFRVLLDRHEALRTSFGLIADVPVQFVHRRVDLTVEYDDIAPACLDDMITGFIRPFDLSTAPLLRLRLTALSPAVFLLCFDVHHIVCDGSAMETLISEFTALYNGETLPPLNIRYRDFCRWQNRLFETGKMEAQQAYWLGIYGDLAAIPRINITGDYPRPALFTFAGSTLEFKLSPAQTREFQELAAENRATLFMNLLAVLNVLMYRYSGQDDLVMGCGIAGRRHADLQWTVGMFVNILAVRNRLWQSETYRRFLARVRQASLEAFENQDVPFEELVEKLAPPRDPSRHALVDVSLVVQNFAEGEIDLEGLRLTPYKYKSRTAKQDLTLYARQVGEELCFNLEYYTGIFKPETVERLARHFTGIIRQVCAHPDIVISAVDLLTPGERHRLLHDFNRTAAPFPQDTTLHRLFAEQAVKDPAKIAVIRQDRCLTYNCLDERANRIGSRLYGEWGVRPDDRVGILLDSSLYLTEAILGILKAGAAYLPLDPASPQERIALILGDSGARLVVTDDESRLSLSGSGHRPLPIAGMVDGGVGILDAAANSHNLAYVIYTSGTTGTPKGVMVEHRSAVNYVCWRLAAFHYSRQDITLQLLAYCFDGFVSNFFPPLLSGGTLILLPEHLMKDIPLVGDTLRDHGVTNTSLVPGMYEALLEGSGDGGLASVRFVVLGGEAAAPSLIQESREKYPHVRLINEYGPTEATVAAAAHLDMTAANTPVIGKPIANTHIFILDNHLRLVPLGVPGELYLAGVGIARGYLNNPELTAERFVNLAPKARQDTRNPIHKILPPKSQILNPKSQILYRTGDRARWHDDGTVEWLGRIDHQVKIRGFRIELGEIESHLLTHEDIKAAAVVLEENRLTAFIETVTGLSEAGLTAYLGRRLPGFMIPAAFVTLEQMPRTAGGKVDRQALAAPRLSGKPEPAAAGGFAAPRDEIEQKIATAWQGVLHLDQPGIDDHFFANGGDSIKALQVCARLRQVGLKLEVSDIFTSPTIRALARCVTSSSQPAPQGIVEGEVPLTPIQRWFFAHHADPALNHHFNQAVLLFRRQGFGRRKVAQLFDMILRHHDALRMVYRWEKAGVVQVNRGLSGRLFDLEVIRIEGEQPPQEVIEREAGRLQPTIDLTAGPLVKLALFESGAGDFLLIVIHHLVVDAVSWRILLEDIAAGYRQLSAGQTIQLPAKTDSFLEWARQQQAYSQAGAAAAEIAPRPRQHHISRQQRKVRFLEAVNGVLDRETTHQLLHRVNLAYRTDTRDLLLAALALALADWPPTAGAAEVWVNLESHGRDSLPEGVDVSRTVGWFTAQYPVLLDLRPAEDLSVRLKRIKERLGRGVSGEMDRLPEPGINFNYLGQYSQGEVTVDGETVFEVSPFKTGDAVSPELVHEPALDIGAIVMEGQLQISLRYFPQEYRRQAVENLAALYETGLRRLIDHCLRQQAGELSPGDYSAAGLTGSQLAAIFAELGAEAGADV